MLAALRPDNLDTYIGQEHAVRRLRYAIAAARIEGRALPHILISGPAGIGKTSLAQAIAGEMGTDIKIVLGSQIKSFDDVVKLLANLDDGDILFIDEIHSMSREVEEYFYHPMEDKQILYNDEWLETADFTLIGATTHPGLLSRPLRDRFKIRLELTLYDATSLAAIAGAVLAMRGLKVDPSAAGQIGVRARGVPRVAVALAERVYDWVVAHGMGNVTEEAVLDCMGVEGVDPLGLTETDYRYLSYLASAKRPVGLPSLASAINIDKDYIEQYIEPWLIHLGFVVRSRSGRVITERGLAYLRAAEAASAEGE